MNFSNSERDFLLAVITKRLSSLDQSRSDLKVLIDDCWGFASKRDQSQESTAAFKMMNDFRNERRKILGRIERLTTMKYFLRNRDVVYLNKDWVFNQIQSLTTTIRTIIKEGNLEKDKLAKLVSIQTKLKVYLR